MTRHIAAIVKGLLEARDGTKHFGSLLGYQQHHLHEAEIALLKQALMEAEAAPQQEPVGWDGAEEWEKLAWHLCAEENGEDACNDLIWEGGPIPEPWGDRWMKYEGEARKMIDLVRTHVPAPQPAPAPLSEREAFEAWYCKQMSEAGYGSDCTIHQLREENHYGEHRVVLNGKWEGWQARAAIAAQEGKQ